MRALLSAVFLVAAFAATAQAPNRTIPTDAKRAAMRHVQLLVVDVDGKQRELAPGAQIRDTSNRIVLPATLQSARDVKFVEDADGRIRHVWILAPQEAQGSR
jgi:hypothetical protein